MNSPISRITSTFAIAGLLFMAPLMAMARMAAPTMPQHRSPSVQKRATSSEAKTRLAAGETEAPETDK